MNYHQMYAREVLNVSEAWEWCSVKTLGSEKQLREGRATHFELRGAEPIGVYLKGPKKGRPKWPPDKDCDVFIVEFKHFREWLERAKAARAEAGE